MGQHGHGEGLALADLMIVQGTTPSKTEEGGVDLMLVGRVDQGIRKGEPSLGHRDIDIGQKGLVIVVLNGGLQLLPPFDKGLEVELQLLVKILGHQGGILVQFPNGLSRSVLVRSENDRIPIFREMLQYPFIVRLDLMVEHHTEAFVGLLVKVPWEHQGQGGVELRHIDLYLLAYEFLQKGLFCGNRNKMAFEIELDIVQVQLCGKQFRQCPFHFFRFDFEWWRMVPDILDLILDIATRK